jgi:CRISPR-associated protein Csb3
MAASPIEFRFDVCPTNPGQFFACCGLFELASRTYEGAQAWFEQTRFVIRAVAPSELAKPTGFLGLIISAHLEALDHSDETASPILIGDPFHIRLDWWREDRDLKVWAGSMRSLRIAAAMKAAIRTDACVPSAILNHGAVVYDPVETGKKVEPFYFDARRGSAAQAVDVGFSADALQMTTIAYPAVEFLCLVGLQRCRPSATTTRRVFEYSTWGEGLDMQVAPAATNGLLPFVGGETYRFENAFRTDQRKHKAFTPATHVQRSE